MKNPQTPLRLLAATNNDRGDLFTRLTGDLFFALGYDDLRFDVAKPGREIDILGQHRHEPRRLVAECKAHKKRMGGDELNKFLGVVTRERSKDEKTPVTGYFVSLGGFTEPSKDQESETSDQQRIILLDGQQVIDELTRIRIVVSREDALERAGRCLQAAERTEADLTNAKPDGAELLGHKLGYVWVVYYAQDKQWSHYALIHADGSPLATSVAEAVIQADKECKGSLHTLTYLSPPTTAADREQRAREVDQRYRQWIVTEFGDIQLDGLPADADLSAFRMKLEGLFVPLRLTRNWTEATPDGTRERVWTGPVGEFLTQHPRFSLLAKPGGGKTTLLKRLAVAYADPSRQLETDDGLPERDWLPLLLRCRELKDRAHRPIRELLNDLPGHAGMNDDEAKFFRDRMDEALRSGQVLLLIDGLDEISDEGARTTFASHLRTFLAMFPHVAMVATSREAGYRHVAGVVASACEQATLAPFDEDDVHRLCEAWHVHVVADSKSVRAEARELADTIWQNERIRALAENPLMLTTLLVVRRCVGELPTRRVELYRESVKVLIRTWNTQGYEPMDLDETLAQLSYVACAMTNDGVQQIGHRQLLKLLREAREEMPAELSFTKISPSDFIKRVEYRSSLVMQTGHEVINDEMQPVYEFRHLTFQEYLSARGFVEEQYPGRNEGRPLVELLEPHFEDEGWREVIPLAAVLAGRKAEPLVRRLTAVCEGRILKLSYPEKDDVTAPPVILLRQCLLDEVLVAPATLKSALRQMGRHGNEDLLKGSVISLQRGRFGEVFQEVVESAYLGSFETHSHSTMPQPQMMDGPVELQIGSSRQPKSDAVISLAANWDEFIVTMSDLTLESVVQEHLDELSEDVTVLLGTWLRSCDRTAQVRAALVCMWLAFKTTQASGPLSDEQQRRWGLAFEGVDLPQTAFEEICRLLTLDDPPVAMSAAWALAWTGAARLADMSPEPDVLLALFRLCRSSESRGLRMFAAFAFAEQALLPRDTFASDVWGNCDAWFDEFSPRYDHVHQAKARLVLAWYQRRPWSDTELTEKVRKLKGSWSGPTGNDLLAKLGGDPQGGEIS